MVWGCKQRCGEGLKRKAEKKIISREGAASVVAKTCGEAMTPCNSKGGGLCLEDKR